MPSRPPAPPGPAFNDAELAAAGERATAVWATESGRERDRLLTLPPAARLAALDDDATRLLLRPDHRAEVRASLAPDPVMEGSRALATTWEIERRRLAVLFFARQSAPVGIGIAALAPFAISAWRGGLGLGDALVGFLTPGAPLIGVVLAAVGAGVLSRIVDRANSLDGLAGLLVAAFGAGIAGLAVALGVVF